SPTELAKLLSDDFSEEMASRDEILKAADEPAPIAPPRTMRSTRPPPLPGSVAPTGAVGEIGARDDSKPRVMLPDAVPSMIVQPGSARAYVPPPQVIDLSSNMLPDSWMIDPNTDLLRGHRLRSLRNAAIAFGVVAAVTVVIFFIANSFGDASNHNIAPV